MNSLLVGYAHHSSVGVRLDHCISRAPIRLVQEVHCVSLEDPGCTTTPGRGHRPTVDRGRQPPTIGQPWLGLARLLNVSGLVGRAGLTPRRANLPRLPWRPDGAADGQLQLMTGKWLVTRSTDLQGRRCGSFGRLVRACRLRGVHPRRHLCLRSSGSGPDHPPCPR